MLKLYLKFLLYIKIYLVIIILLFFIISLPFKEYPQYIHDITISVKYSNDFKYTFNIIDTNYSETPIKVEFKNNNNKPYIKYGNTVIGYNIVAFKITNSKITKK